MAKSRHDESRLIGGALIVCRRSDGRKESCDLFDSLRGKQRSLKSHLDFRAWVKQWPDHRRRFAYIVNVYSKDT